MTPENGKMRSHLARARPSTRQCIDDDAAMISSATYVHVAKVHRKCIGAGDAFGGRVGGAIGPDGGKQHKMSGRGASDAL